MTDPIVEDVRRIRAKIAEECGFDLRRISEHARQAADRVPGIRRVTPEDFWRGRTPARAQQASTQRPR